MACSKITYSRSYESPKHSTIPQSNLATKSWCKKPNSIRCEPNEEDLKVFFVSYGYSIEVTKKCRRIYLTNETTTLDKDDSAAVKKPDYQLYCGNIPSDVNERDIFELFHAHGKINEIRIMMDGITQKHRGFAFINCISEIDQKTILEKCNGYEIRSKRYLKLNVCKPNRSLYIANIPKSKNAKQLRTEFDEHLHGIIDLIVYRPFSNCNIHDQNRGFCFIEFDTHEAARSAKRKIDMDPKKLFSNVIFVDWADTIETPTEEVMQNVRVLYVRNIHESVSEIQLKQIFSSFGSIEHVKRIKNFAFIHFTNRNDALNAMKSLQSLELCGENLSILLSYPPLDKKKKEELLRSRQERIMRENPMRIRY